jgi:hypothetical protein
MFDRPKEIVGTLTLAAVLAVGSGCAVSQPPAGRSLSFEYTRDSFAFANETVWRYADGKPVTDGEERNGDDVRYTRRCFLMSEAVVQFWKVARFDPDAAPVTRDELARRVRRVRSFHVWHDAPPMEDRVVFPGYANLREFSDQQGPLLRENMGPGWTTYFDLRKFPMPYVPNHKHQAQLNDQIAAWLSAGHPMILWLYNFPHVNINHCVVAISVADDSAPAGKVGYWVVDPNFTDRPRRLEYDPSTREFSYEPTFYFPGGFVVVRPMYLGWAR